MPDLTPAEAARWIEVYGNKPYPGNAEKQEGKCNTKLHNKALKNLQIETPRYCGRKAGWGTEHSGIGCCKQHLGNMKNHIRHAANVQVERYVRELKELDDEPPPMGPPIVELDLHARRTKQIYEILRANVAELRNVATTTVQGEEKIRAAIIAMGEYGDRLASQLQFAAKFNLEEKKVQLATSQAVTIALKMRGIGDSSELGLTDDQVVIFRQLLETALGEISDKLLPTWYNQIMSKADYEIEPIDIDEISELSP